MENTEDTSKQMELLYERANSISHGIGFLLTIPGLALLVYMAYLHGDTQHIISVSIYGISLMVLYAASTLCHGLQDEKAKNLFEIVDHCAIYLLIAGTYTPITTLLLKGEWGEKLVVWVWIMAAVGIVFKIFYTGKFEWLSLITYILMGCMIVVAIEPLMQNVPLNALLWLLAGAIAYIVGVVFYVWQSLPYHHMIWHLFVMAGSICHYVAILLYALPLPA